MNEGGNFCSLKTYIDIVTLLILFSLTSDKGEGIVGLKVVTKVTVVVVAPASFSKTFGEQRNTKILPSNTTVSW